MSNKDAIEVLWNILFVAITAMAIGSKFGSEFGFMFFGGWPLLMFAIRIVKE